MFQLNHLFIFYFSSILILFTSGLKNHVHRLIKVVEAVILIQTRWVFYEFVKSPPELLGFGIKVWDFKIHMLFLIEVLFSVFGDIAINFTIFDLQVWS